MKNKPVLRKDRVPFPVVVLAFVLVLVLGSFLSLYIGKIPLSWSQIWATLSGHGTEADHLTLFQFRMTRSIMAILVGAGISVSGVILQATARNPLAEPGVLGINAGAGFFVVLFQFYLHSSPRQNSLTGTLLLPAVALLGALLAAGIIYSVSLKDNTILPSRMLLVGIGVNAAFQSGITIFSLKMNPSDFLKTMTWLSGSIWSSSWTLILALLPWLLVIFPLVMHKSRVLDILSFNENTAIGLGVSLQKERRQLLILAVLLAGTCVSVGGGLTFLGLISPQIAKSFTGVNHRHLLPLSACIGSCLLLFSDILARVVMPSAELPVGIIISIIGAPYFLYLLIRG